MIRIITTKRLKELLASRIDAKKLQCENKANQEAIKAFIKNERDLNNKLDDRNDQNRRLRYRIEELSREVEVKQEKILKIEWDIKNYWKTILEAVKK